ncbi:hypothetical protein T08_7176 [Trichinella sp. T8]|nr:hypothetical protein T08_7176 [Trichinella sp. T8]
MGADSSHHQNMYMQLLYYDYTCLRLEFNAMNKGYAKNKKFQCAKTGFERCAMQITIAIKVPYRRLECTRSFDLRGKW